MKLADSVTTLPLVGLVYAKRLEKLDIKNIEDLLYHAPHRYLDFSKTTDIGKAVIDELVTIKGTIDSFNNTYTRYGKNIQVAKVIDDSGKVSCIWFNQPYLAQTLIVGTKVALAGKLGWYGRNKAFISPEYEVIREGKKSVHTARLVPIYHETARVSSKWIRGRVSFSLPKVINQIKEYLPNATLKKHNLLGLKKSIKDIHFPINQESADDAKKRLSFDEFLFFHLNSLRKKQRWQSNIAQHKLSIDKKLVNEFINSLPFTLTNSQKRSIDEILFDLQKDIPMNRLLEGDVGSGKTIVAATTAFVAFTNGFQTAFMAPTQILAQQHYTTLKEVFDKFNARISLLTSTKTKKSIGKTDIYIGTHSLIHKSADFDEIAVVIIDEQHRFGVEQRKHLVKKTGNKKSAPHVLTMTATPIPRTVALTAYGDLDLSTLDELPKGRKPITTWIVPPNKRNPAYKWIEEKIKKEKTQVFVICPLIEESDKETMKQVRAASAEYERLAKIFPNLKLGLLHSRLKASKKDSVMDKFRQGDIDILVSTPVVEVGVDVPNATIMLIEAADRFGLAQLHQLRGRVGRGGVKSYCLLFSESKSKNVTTRLNALKKSVSGFELAELDLKIRGPGEIIGAKQHGFPGLKIASWQDTKLIRDARKVAEEATNKPKKYNKLFKMLNDKTILN